MIFNKNKKPQSETLINGVLDSIQDEVVIVRGNECELLFMNHAAKSRLRPGAKIEQGCKIAYAKEFEDLCAACPLSRESHVTEPVEFDVKDEDGHVFSVVVTPTKWLDGQSASILMVRNVDEERIRENKLYTLAYVDQLTGVPNRAKFKEDFEAASDAIAAEEKWGAVAIFDLDNFKGINDTYGHNTGDIMLKRLAEHLNGDKRFKGKIYRLGGDEFVLFFCDDKDLYENTDELKKHYQKIMLKAFLTYTMPNIELSCTLSMGAAFFPEHGETASELLRKADIALYKAKENGKNKLALFEEQYDSAQKFKDLYINIQPILTHFSSTYGYELVDRGNEEVDSEEAVNLSEFDRTMDALGLGDLQNDARYFISYTNQLTSATVLNNLPKDKFVVQVHINDVQGKDLEKYTELKSHGYSIALTGIRNLQIPNELMELADYLKFENRGIDSAEMKKFIAARGKKTFIATSVDSSSDFEYAKKQGFELFQGFFFNQRQPAVVKKTKDIDPLKVNYFRLLKLTSTDGFVDFKEISEIISSDVALSYKLLKLLNSAAVGLSSRISSIPMAVAYLGEENLKKWIGMLALRGIGSDAPLELIRMSLIRARFGELLAPHFKPRRDEKHVFLLGMLSLLHIALDMTKEELLEEIPVAEDIKASLLTKDGVYSDMISFYDSYEYANWEEVIKYAETYRLGDQLINESYLSAVKWYNDMANI